MTLQEEVTQLDEYDRKDFEKTAPFVPASPFCKKVHQHKNEDWVPNDNQLINQLKKAGLDTEVENIVKVLDEWRGPNLGKVWISDTLPADLNLPLTDEDHPAEITVQAFFIGKNLPSFVLTLFNLQNNEGGPDLEKHIHKHTVATLQELHESLLDFCHDRFAILGCTFDMQNFNSESLKQELELREEECEEFYDGPINLDAKVFNNMTKAAVLLQGTSCVTCYMPSSTKHIGTGEYQSILFDQTWRNVVHRLIEFLTHTEQTTQRICCKSALKLEVAILEAACRVGRSRLVTIKSSPNAEVSDCVRKMNNKENCKLRLEPSDEIDGSFHVISQQSTIIFMKNEEGSATVTFTSYHDSAPAESWMDGNSKIETVTGPAENTKTTLGIPETRDTHKKHVYQTQYPIACKIVGLPEINCKESDEDLPEKAWHFFFDVLGLPLQRKEILSAKRLRGHALPREVCVVFSSEEARNTVLETGLKLAGYYPNIEEFLPTAKHHLLLDARSSFGPGCAWSKNGVVFVKMHDGVIVEVHSCHHLSYIISQNFGSGCYLDYNKQLPVHNVQHFLLIPHCPIITTVVGKLSNAIQLPPGPSPIIRIQTETVFV